MCLALTVAYYLNLDEPYWAMTSAAVVSFPTVGGVISKSLGRIAGSLLGAIAALLLAGHTLNEPWFFLLSMSAWLGFCTWACAHFTNNVAYAFQLAGYTAAIIAFPMVNITEASQLWDIAQARVCEVIVGILCGGMMMMILPSSSDATALLTALKNMHARLLEHASLLWQPETNDAIRAAHEGVIGQILTMNLLRIQAFWSHYRFRQQNARLNALLHQQLRMTSVISSLRRMLLNWPSPPGATREILEQLLTALASSQTDAYTVARIIAPLRPTNVADYRHVAFWQRLRYFCRLYLQSSQELHRLQSGVDDHARLARTSALARHTDNAEAMWSGLRTFCTLMMIGAWSIASQWDAGANALTLAAISCVLYSAVAAPFKSLSLLMRTLVLLSLFSFVVKFGLMVQISDLWQFLLFLFPLLATMQLLKLQMPKFAALWGQLIVFMGSFIAVTNPPVYDFAQMALFSPYDVERVYGKPFADIAISEHYDELVADERIRKKYLNARDFFQRLAEIQFESGYPYIMYEDTVNRANPVAGRINMSNLCSEILQVNCASEYDENLDYARTGHDISCNLGSLNIAHTMDSPDFARTVETAVRGLTAVSDMSHIRSVPSIEAGNAASHAIGLGQMNLHGYLAREGIAYGSPEALDFTNLYFYAITWHALRTSMLLARERGETFAGFKQSRYASGEYFSQYLQGNWQPKTAKVGELFARSGITLPTREMWAQLRDDVMRYGIYNQNLQAVPPTGSISYINHATSSIHPIVAKVEIRKEGKTGRVYYPAPFMTNENLALYQDAYEIGAEKIIDTYAEATRHVDQGLSLTLFFPDTATTRDINKAQIYAWRKGIKTLYYIRLRQMALEGTEIEGCVSCAL